MKKLLYVIKEPGRRVNENTANFADAKMGEILKFHQSVEGYEPTPLAELKSQAERMGLGKLWVKDESKRFGLNAFKGLGGSYALSKCIPEKGDKLTFVTATDGNHGRGVAWAANKLGHLAVVYLPKGSAKERLDNIKALGAYAEITDMNYDDTVRYASDMAGEKGWILVQDTSWPGYEEIPLYIMQGYTTLAMEAFEQIKTLGEEKPTHVFLQAGVGSFAGAIGGYFAENLKEECPVIVVVEPEKADCIYKTALADDGSLHTVTGDMDSIMAGLCCGEPCSLGWDILKEWASCYISCSDEYAANGMRLLGKPLEEDPKVISGESGAVTAGVLEGIMLEGDLEGLKNALGLNKDSKVLLISTEGDTDKENYNSIMNKERDDY